MSNLWKDVWNGKKPGNGILLQQDVFSDYSTLKGLDGYDVNVVDKEPYFRGFYDSFHKMWDKIHNKTSAESVYEVGCGSGANLYLLQNIGRGKYCLGGIDYSESLIEVAKEIVKTNDIAVGEANEMPVEPSYDIVLSDSVFAYFQDIDYARQVLDKMFEKAVKAVVILEIFDKSMEEECIRHRRSMISDYDERYKGLGKLFYPKDMFIEFARKHNADIEFTDVYNPYYWNSEFLYNCFIYKK